MKSNRWELHTDPAADGATNMKIDGDLLRAIETCAEPRTVIRFYSWHRPTLSLGRNQTPRKGADLDFCNRHGIDVVHRPTGGLAVLHDDEITYAVISNEPAAFAGGSVYGTYRRVSEALADGYRRLGVDVALAARSDRNLPAVDADDPCFVSQSRYELAFNGRKLVGSAQRRLRRAFLQHGSMPLSVDRELLARATGFGDPECLEREVTALDECVERIPSRDDLVATFVSAFADYFQVTFDRFGGGKSAVPNRGVVV